MNPHPTRRTPVVEGWNGMPCSVHWRRATKVEPGVRIGDVLLEGPVTLETCTHILVTTHTLEPKP